MKRILATITALIGITVGLAAIILLLGDLELIVAVLSLTFGIWAMIWILMARNSLSPGSSLRAYTTYFLSCLVFVLLGSIWNYLITLFQWTGLLVYPQYIFVSVTYIVFVVASYKIFHIGQEFGFRDETKRLQRIILEKSKRK